MIEKLSLGEGYELIAASLFDVPFVFGLMMNGSELGVFTDTYLMGAGAFKLFWCIVSAILAMHLFRRGRLLVISKDGLAIGFTKVENLGIVDGCGTKVIEMLAISIDHRNARHGTSVLDLFVKAQPPDTRLLVYCTKYARAMQHTLKKLRFVRNAKARIPLEEYSLITRTQVLHDVGAARACGRSKPPD